MTSVEKKGHIRPKPKRHKTSAPALSGHVQPGRGRLARQHRQRVQRDLRQGRADFDPTQTAGALAPLVGMSPLRGRRGARGEGARPQDRVRPTGLVWMSWRWVSGVLSAMLLIILAVLLTTDRFYVSSVAVGGVNYLTREDVFRFSETSNEHLFWLDAEQIAARLEANNNIASAEVIVGWPPNPVQIVVREREPVLVWEQGDDRVWADINGVVMYQREDRADLLRVVYDPDEPQPEAVIGPYSSISTEIIHGALLLVSSTDQIDMLLYHPEKGLGWRDPRGWMVWFGVGDNMAMKAHVYEALVAYNIDQVQFAEVDVSDPDHPVYSILWRKTD